MMQLVCLIGLIVVLHLFIEDKSFVVFAKLAVLLYLVQWFMAGIEYIGNLFRIG